MMKRPSFFERTVVWMTLCAFLLAACAEAGVPASALPDNTSSFAGTATLKADGSTATKSWTVEGQGEFGILKATSADGDVLFEAQLLSVDQGVANVLYSAPIACSIEFDLATGELLDSDCDLEQIEVLGQGILSLWEDAEAAGVWGASSGPKADGYLINTACVVGVVGALTWSYVLVGALSAVAAPVAISVAIGAGFAGWAGTIFGFSSVAYTCYEAWDFDPESDFEECAYECEGDVDCVSGCVLATESELSELEAIDEAIQRAAYLHQCMRNCDEQTACLQVCVEGLSPTLLYEETDVDEAS